jgi:exopolysaccharide production protein ExoZ
LLWAVTGGHPVAGHEWFDVLKTVLFVHGWHPVSINSVVPGDWSIAAEMTFYFIFPALALSVRSTRAALLLFLVNVIVLMVLNPLAQDFWTARLPADDVFLIGQYLNFWIGNQLPVFAAGFVTYFLITRHPWQWSIHWMTVLFWLTVAAILTLPFYMHVQWLPLLYCVAIYCMANGAARFLTVAPIRYLGEISFGVYLWHFGVIDILNTVLPVPLSPLVHYTEIYGLTLVGASVLAAITHRLIERPMVNLGNRLIARAAEFSHRTDLIVSVKAE